MCQQKISLSEKRQLRRCGRHPDHLIFARGEIPKDVHQSILALVPRPNSVAFSTVSKVCCVSIVFRTSMDSARLMSITGVN